MSEIVRDYKKQQYIYHITSMSNMHGIISKGLCPRNKITPCEDVADEDIIAYRKENNILSYVPFHFMPKSPFADAVQKKYPDISFVYIMVRREWAKSNQFFIIPQHPMSESMKYDLEICSYEEGVEKINWKLMNKKDYQDHDCKQVCMAECIYNGVVDVTSLAKHGDVKFVVKDENDKKCLEKIIKEVNSDCSLEIWVQEKFFVSK